MHCFLVLLYFYGGDYKMITFVTDKDKNNSPLEDDTPEIGVTSKGQPVEKIIEDAEAANEAEKAEKTEEPKEETPSAPSSEELIQNLIEREFSIKEHNTKFYKGNLRNGMSLVKNVSRPGF